MAKRYETDLTDEQWAEVEPLLPPAKRGGRPRSVGLRLILDTIFYLNKTGCQWRMLPTDLAKRSTAHEYFAAWKADGTWQRVMDALRRRVRVEAGREPEPSKAEQGGHRLADGQGLRGGRGAGVRRGQEGQRPQAAPAASGTWWWTRWAC